jgi:HAMP domain-containing protein
MPKEKNTEVEDLREEIKRLRQVIKDLVDLIKVKHCGPKEKE